MVVLRDKAGPIGHVAIGSAILDADWGRHALLTTLPSGEEAEALADFVCDTPAQAEHFMDELNELGDVPFDPLDFAAKWFCLRAGIAAVEWLLGDRSRARRVLTDAVCAKLERVKRVLDAARRPGHRFHFVELEPGEDRHFAGPPLREEPERKQLQRRPGPSEPRR
jgi:hypothetical protein